MDCAICISQSLYLWARSIQQNSNRSDRENWSTSKGGPVFSKLFRLDRTDPLSFGPKFPEILVEWIAPIVIYRPPYSDEHKVPMSTFFAEFADYVKTILLSNEELLILGDFNIHIDVAGDSDANKLSDFFESVGLQQHVEQHTHVQGHTLDLVISRRSDNIIEDLPRVDRFLSDHSTVLFCLKSIKPSLLEKTIS